MSDTDTSNVSSRVNAWLDGWCDEEYDPFVHAVRDEPPELDDDDYDLDLSDETPEDRRTLIALMWRREWMAHR